MVKHKLAIVTHNRSFLLLITYLATLAKIFFSTLDLSIPMQVTDNLRTILSRIEAYCTQHRIAVFYGDTTVKTKGAYVWTGDNPQDWQKYIAILPVLGPKILHIGIVEHEALEAGEKQAVLAYGEGLKGKEKRDWQSAYKMAEAVVGFISDLHLTFFHEDITYYFLLEAEWFERVGTIRPVEGTDEDEAKEGEDPRLEEKLEREARLLIKNEAFLKAGSHNARRDVAFQ